MTLKTRTKKLKNSDVFCRKIWEDILTHLDFVQKTANFYKILAIPKMENMGG